MAILQKFTLALVSRPIMQ